MRHFPASKHPGRRLIGFNHEHLDDLMRVSIIFGDRINDMALIIKDQFHIWEIKHDHAVAHSSFAKSPG